MSEITTHIIDEYLLGRLESKARRELESKMAEDPAFALEVQKRKTIIDKVDAFGDHALKERLRHIHQKEMRRKILMKRYSYLAYAAAALLLLALAAYFLSTPAPPKTEELYFAYYEPYPLQFTDRDNQTEAQLASADQLYASGNFGQALPLFEAVFAADTSQSKVRIALGICQMQKQDYNQALRYFQPLILSDFDPYQEQALWYAALAYLQKEDRLAAKKYLARISENPSSIFYSRALELQARL